MPTSCVHPEKAWRHIEVGDSLSTQSLSRRDTELLLAERSDDKRLATWCGHCGALNTGTWKMPLEAARVTELEGLLKKKSEKIKKLFEELRDANGKLGNRNERIAELTTASAARHDALQSGPIDPNVWRGPCDHPNCDQAATHIELHCETHRRVSVMADLIDEDDAENN